MKDPGANDATNQDQLDKPKIQLETEENSGNYGNQSSTNMTDISNRSSSSFPYCPKVPIMSIGFHHKQYISIANADEEIIEEVIKAMKYNYSKGVGSFPIWSLYGHQLNTARILRPPNLIEA